MRKKQNIQRTDYAENGELICFGLSEHTLSEHLPRWSDKAKEDLAHVQKWLSKADEMMTRPAYNSAFSLNNDLWRAQLRLGLGALIIRELPIKSFASR